MIAMEKVCVACGKKFIVREAESHNWKEINYCIICISEHSKKKQQEKDKGAAEKNAVIRAKNQAEFEEKISKRNVTALSDIQFDDENVLYIIGNGFDLMHGVKSSYYSFRDSLGQSSAIRSILETFWTPEDIWADFENGLAYFNINMMANRFTVDNWLNDTGFFKEEESAGNFQMAAECVVNPIATVVDELPRRFRSWVEKLSVRSDDRPLKTLIRNGKVLNFNYTEFIEDLYGTPMSSVCYIHGCRRKNKYHPKEKLILGHKPGANDAAYELDEKQRKKRTYHSEIVDRAQEVALRLITEYDQELSKSTSEIIENHQVFFDSLKDIKNIVVIGHSLSEVDYDYFKKVSESVESSEDVNWYFGCHGLGDLNHLDALVSLLGLRNVNIFRSDKIRVNIYPEFEPVKNKEPIPKKLAVSKSGRWEVIAVRNSVKIIDSRSESVFYEVVIKTPVSKTVFTADEKAILLISYAFPGGIQLIRFGDNSWEYCDELLSVQNQCIINRRLRKVFMTNERITFVYNSRVRKYSLIDGTVVYNQAVRQAFLKNFSSDGIDVTGEFVRADR